jgi:hypothetical protein
MHSGTARLMMCSMAGSLALAACGGSSTHTTSAGVSQAAKAPTVTTPTTTRTAATKPPTLTSAIDLSGTPGVTPAEQNRAEDLIKATIIDLKRFETPAEAYAAGYRSIGDRITGDEHYVNWSYSNDGHILDPMRPESVVYEYRNGVQRAVAAMYALPFGSRFTDAPDVGGALTQWHVHANLCLTNNSQQRVVSGLTSVGGTCPPGSAKLGNTPMLHVWVVPNPCGPFAALEGVGAGQVPAGQTRQCITKYASVP